MLVGDFNNYASTGRNRILRSTRMVRLMAPSITSPVSGRHTSTCCPLHDGKCFVSGSFTAYDGNPANGLCAERRLCPPPQRCRRSGCVRRQACRGRAVPVERVFVTDPSYNVGTGFTNAIGYSHPLRPCIRRVIAVGAYRAQRRRAQLSFASRDPTATSRSGARLARRPLCVRHEPDERRTAQRAHPVAEPSPHWAIPMQEVPLPTGSSVFNPTVPCSTPS
jgi:hypothetical protein